MQYQTRMLHKKIWKTTYEYAVHKTVRECFSYIFTDNFRQIIQAADLMQKEK
jgi:hypothetical protein